MTTPSQRKELWPWQRWVVPSSWFVFHLPVSSNVVSQHQPVAWCSHNEVGRMTFQKWYHIWFVCLYRQLCVVLQTLKALRQVEVINFGDCLVRSKGALAIADALKEGLHKLKVLPSAVQLWVSFENDLFSVTWLRVHSPTATDYFKVAFASVQLCACNWKRWSCRLVASPHPCETVLCEGIPVIWLGPT